MLPCYISPFKQNGCYAGGEDRVKMLRKATATLENVKVSKWEIKQEKVSYSADAVKHYREKYPDSEIYFVIGADCVSRLPEWYEADYLANNAVFYVLPRAGYSMPKKLLDSIKSFGFKLRKSTLKVSDESSTLVRVALALGKTEYLPSEAVEYIEKHGLYTEYAPIVNAYKVFNLKRERIEHTFRAVKEGIRLSKIHDEDVGDTVKALLLHDVGKYATASDLDKQNVNVDPAVANLPKSVRHALVSAAIARDCFGLNERIVSAISKHTTGATEMNMLDKIVYLADATEEGREYEGVDGIRRAAAKDLDRAMLRSLKLTLKALKTEGGDICSDTVDAYRKFIEICKLKTAKKTAAPVFKQEEKAEQPEHKEVAKITDSKSLARFIAAKLSEKKGRNIIMIDIAHKTVIADYFVIASAASTTAVRAMADYVDEKLSKDYGIEPLRRDVSPKWAVIDYGGVILHVQHEEVREFYHLEKLWDDGENIIHYKD